MKFIIFDKTCSVSGIGMCMNMVSTIGIVPHYFEEKKEAAYACTGLGSGIATLIYPTVLSKMQTILTYKETMFYMTPITVLSILAPLVFIPQLEQKKPDSAVDLALSYIKCLRRFVTPFYLLNAFFCRGSQVAMMVLLYSTISQSLDLSTANISATVLGLAFLGGAFSLTIFLLKFKVNQLVLQIICNITISLACFTMGYFNRKLVFYIGSGLFGVCHGVTIAIKGSLSTHLYPSYEVEYSFGKAEGVSGLASFIIPLTAGYIQSYISYAAGLYYLSGLSILGTFLLLLPAIIRPSLLKPYGQLRDSNTEKFNIYECESGDCREDSCKSTQKFTIQHI